MAKESGGAPLPRRVPGAGDSPRPPAGVKPPPLPESVLERLRAATEAAREEERAHAGEESAPRLAASPGVSVPMPRRPPASAAQPEQSPEDGSAERPPAVRGQAFPEALTQPIPVFSPTGHAEVAEPRVDETVAPPDGSVPADAPAPPEGSRAAGPSAPPDGSQPADTPSPPESSWPADAPAPPGGSMPADAPAPAEGFWPADAPAPA